MHIKKFSCWFNKDGVPGSLTIEHAFQSLFCDLEIALRNQSLPVTIRLTKEKQRLDYRIVADVTFEYSACGRCGVELCEPDKADVCFYCIGPMCGDCWENHGHCGHPEAVKMNEEARAVVQPKGAPKYKERRRGQEYNPTTGEYRERH